MLRIQDILSRSVLCVCLGTGITAGCKNASENTPARTRGTQGQVESSELAAERRAFKEKTQQELKDIQAGIDELTPLAADSPTVENLVYDLDKKHEALGTQLYKITDVSPEEWPRVKRQVEERLAELEKSLDHARQEVKKLPETKGK